MRETPGADSYSVHKLNEEIRTSRVEGIPPPDFDEELARWRSEGWPGPPDPLHARLIAWERMRRLVEDPEWSQTSPDIEWRYGRELLAFHRYLIAHHDRELQRIQMEERSARRR